MQETKAIAAQPSSQRWEKGTRYYIARLHQDLWGHWVLTIGWGRRETHLGQTQNRPCTSYAEGLALLTAVRKRRVQRGYHSLMEPNTR